MNNWLNRRADHEFDVLFGIVTGAAGALFAAALVLGFFTRLAWFLYVPGFVLAVLQVLMVRAMARRRRMWDR